MVGRESRGVKRETKQVEGAVYIIMRAGLGFEVDLGVSMLLCSFEKVFGGLRDMSSGTSE